MVAERSKATCNLSTESTHLVVTPSQWAMVIKSGYSHSSEPALELHSRAAPRIRRQHHGSVGPNTGINPGGRQIKKKTTQFHNSLLHYHSLQIGYDWYIPETIKRTFMFSSFWTLKINDILLKNYASIFRSSSWLLICYHTRCVQNLFVIQWFLQQNLAPYLEETNLQFTNFIYIEIRKIVLVKS